MNCMQLCRDQNNFIFIIRFLRCHFAMNIFISDTIFLRTTKKKLVRWRTKPTKNHKLAIKVFLSLIFSDSNFSFAIFWSSPRKKSKNWWKCYTYRQYFKSFSFLVLIRDSDGFRLKFCCFAFRFYQIQNAPILLRIFFTFIVL